MSSNLQVAPFGQLPGMKQSEKTRLINKLRTLYRKAEYSGTGKIFTNIFRNTKFLEIFHSRSGYLSSETWARKKPTHTVEYSLRKFEDSTRIPFYFAPEENQAFQTLPCPKQKNFGSI